VKPYDDLPLAEAAYWLLHFDDQPLLRQPRIEGLALAAALIAQLLITERIAFYGDELFVHDPHHPPDDVTAAVYEAIKAGQHQGYGLWHWLDAIQGSSAEIIREHLVAQGSLRRTESQPGNAGTHRGKSWMRREKASAVVVFEATNHNGAATPWAVLARGLHKGEALSTAGAFLLGLLHAVGLLSHVLDNPTDRERAHAGRQMQSLPPELRLVLAETQARIGAAVLTHRT
jgi:hypothetical protein